MIPSRRPRENLIKRPNYQNASQNEPEKMANASVANTNCRKVELINSLGNTGKARPFVIKGNQTLLQQSNRPPLISFERDEFDPAVPGISTHFLEKLQAQNTSTEQPILANIEKLDSFWSFEIPDEADQPSIESKQAARERRKALLQPFTSLKEKAIPTELFHMIVNDLMTDLKSLDSDDWKFEEKKSSTTLF